MQAYHYTSQQTALSLLPDEYLDTHLLKIVAQSYQEGCTYNVFVAYPENF